MIISLPLSVIRIMSCIFDVMLKLSHFGPLEPSSYWFPCFWTGFQGSFLDPWDILGISWRSPGMSHLFKNPWCSRGKWYLEAGLSRASGYCLLSHIMASRLFSCQSQEIGSTCEEHGSELCRSVYTRNLYGPSAAGLSIFPFLVNFLITFSCL